MKRRNPRMDEPLPEAADVKKAYDALPRSDVPAKLDARILARAREAASKPNNVVLLKLRAMRRWAIPVTAAASVVVVMSVVYETQFSSPRDASVVVTTSTDQAATSPLQDDRVLHPAAPAPETTAKQSAATRAKQRTDAARVNSMPRPPPVVVPGVSLPPIVSLAESVAPAPPATGFSVPMSSPISSGQATVANEPRQERKEQEYKDAGRTTADAAIAPAQLLGKVEKQVEADPLLASLGTLAGHYTYESYRMTMLSGQVLGLKELGYTAATLDIDAQGTLTRRMTMTNGKVVTETAKILEVKLDDNSGYWIAQWPDIRYPVQADISFERGRLVSRTQFEDLADTPRFGNVELAIMHRSPKR